MISECDRRGKKHSGSSALVLMKASLELVRRELRERKQTTHCCLALCGAPWLPRHWSGALDGDIDNAHCSGDWDGEIGARINYKAHNEELAVGGKLNPVYQNALGVAAY
ncbi:hypothetical protein F2P81_018734 [Scophthalmus maximus]|uniref:Uncharacterized protein n=1 Tax=Scophthalmus maximus TaxID=52904 RepID=A0A6A4SAJ2_SCOMX|nr:hypothetical protein F2P81_018734 [Scophthalmus maximus]